MSEPVLIERCSDAFGEYETRWMVEPPAKDVAFRVLEDTWHGDFDVRTIWRYELVDPAMAGVGR
jgi:hypothetical protein